MQFWASPAAEKILRSQEGHAAGQMHQKKNLWGQAAQGANYTLSTAAGIQLPGFSFEVAIVVHAIVK